MSALAVAIQFGSFVVSFLSLVLALILVVTRK